MPDFHRRSARVFLAALVVLGLAGCGSLDGTGDKVASAVKPYKVDVIQGNVVTREQLSLLKIGMPRAQVRDVLGSSLLVSVFHENRWDYVFTLKRPDAPPQARKVTVFFKDEVLARIESDELPSESEFVATLKSQPKSGPLPALQASEESLKKFPAASKPGPVPATVPVAPTSYPPLEPVAQ
jgi:outer membrane protein assembly factor BamE